MAIAARCSACGKSYQLADAQAGLRVRCRACKEQFEVPHPNEELETVGDGVTESPKTKPRRLEAEDRPLPTPPMKSNKALFVVLGVVGGGLLALMLVCGGVVWMLTMQVQKTAVQVTQEVKEIQKQAPPPKVVEPEKKKEDVAALPNIELPKDPKDFDDALNQMRSPNPLVRAKALSWVSGQQPPANAAKRKQIMNAIEERTKDKNALVQFAATSARELWNLEP